MSVGRVQDEHGSYRTLSPELADALRPELEGLAVEIIQDIRAELPEYAYPLEGPYGQSLKEGVHYALTLFVDRIADPDTPRDGYLCVHRKLGHLEFRDGRTLDSLQRAYRIGAQTSWRRLMEMCERAQLSALEVSELAGATIAFLNELSAAALEGYLEAQANTASAQENWRRKLLGMLLEEPPAPQEAITELAERVGWPRPEGACVVVLPPETDRQDSDRPSKLDRDVLADLNATPPRVLVPGALTKRRLHMITRALPDRRLSIGPCLSLREAAESFDLARRTAALAADDHTIANTRVNWAAKHYARLLLRNDDALLDRLCHRWFAPLQSLTPKQHDRIITTLTAWLKDRGVVADMAKRLDVHEQSIRYRLGLLEETFGDSLYDPRARFEMELVLHAGPRGHTPQV